MMMLILMLMLMLMLLLMLMWMLMSGRGALSCCQASACTRLAQRQASEHGQAARGQVGKGMWSTVKMRGPGTVTTHCGQNRTERDLDTRNIIGRTRFWRG